MHGDVSHAPGDQLAADILHANLTPGNREGLLVRLHRAGHVAVAPVRGHDARVVPGDAEARGEVAQAGDARDHLHVEALELGEQRTRPAEKPGVAGHEHARSVRVAARKRLDDIVA